MARRPRDGGARPPRHAARDGAPRRRAFARRRRPSGARRRGPARGRQRRAGRPAPAPGGAIARRRVGADRRIAQRREAQRAPAAARRRRLRARRPREHGLQGHGRHAWPRRRRRGGHRQRDRARPRRCAVAGQRPQHAAAAPAGGLRPTPGARRAGDLRARLHDRRAARRAGAADGADRDQPGGGGDPRGLARGRDGAARARRAAPGARQRARAPAAVGRDAGLGDDDLHRQDRHPHAEPDAGRVRAQLGRERRAAVDRGRAVQRRAPRRAGLDRRPDRDGARRTRRRAGPGRRGDPAAPAAPARTPVRRRAQAHEHAARRHRARPLAALREGRTGSGARTLPWAARCRRRAAAGRRRRAAGGTDAGRPGHARARGRRARRPRRRHRAGRAGAGAGPGAARSGRAARPAAPRGARRGGGVPRGRHPADHDHRRPPADGVGDRARPRVRRSPGRSPGRGPTPTTPRC